MNEEDLPYRYRIHTPLTPAEKWAYRGMVVGIVPFWAGVVLLVKWLHQ